ncbi:DUF5681 domain-containing protein [Escherichia coli]|uniref:DUF5681 domain-containing protein n=1 Tax=Escherichia coli TaxID=562 RepID=UPI000E2154B7|nr:DUF5681 domain-containing protein [Escherichia coli]
MTDDTENPERPGRGGKSRFKPGTSGNPKGRPKGIRDKRLTAVEDANDRLMDNLSALCKEHAGKTAEEIFRDMNYNPLIHAIELVRELKHEPNAQTKIIGMLLNKQFADLKSVDTTSNEIKTIRIEFEDPFERPAIEASVTPVLTHVIDAECGAEGSEGDAVPFRYKRGADE